MKTLARILLGLVLIAVGMELGLGGIDNSAPLWIQTFDSVLFFIITAAGIMALIELAWK